ncbi:A disintegrin and metalloproteinase with thrombospondin motifs 12 [Bombina bombina]|uniref:A disintegrin and metalloproteinase with thrombospondin motifs 12 n=1 Tax=Bombina bombina TaxID=8345 RepID=UPI00235AFB04|nr:A disintegrin and metalloproteinase with thrombospondin motifs 12 [Bombina bombina]
MQCMQRGRITNISFLFHFLYLLTTCHSRKLQQSKHEIPYIRQEHLINILLDSYEVVEPIKVDENGRFLSYTLSNQDESSRWKRDLSSKTMYYKLFHQGNDLFFNLTLNKNFDSNNYIVERRTGNQRGIEITASSGNYCHLIGSVKQPDNKQGFAVISACNGLTGFFRLSHGEYFIEPLHNASQAEGKQYKHIIYKKEAYFSQRNRRALPITKQRTCGVKDNLISVLQQEHQREKWERKQEKGRKISPRSVSKERWVETLVVVDTKMIEYHGSDNVESYVFTIMNMVTGLFHDPSIGNAIHIKVVRLILLEEEEEGLKIVHHADQTLSSFCKWQKSINPKSDLHPAHHDVAVLLTRKDICAGKNVPCETLGLSHLSGMCQPFRSCNINEDSGLPVAFTIAHELGHSFGMQHDGQGNDCDSAEGPPYIMSRQLKYDSSPLTWSSCSKEYVTRFLDRGWGSCLDDVPAKKDFKPPIVAPGVLYDVNHQCQLQYGPNATFCADVDNICHTLWCSVNGYCRSKLDAAADGTKCGENKWCFNGKCINVGKQPETINGRWGAWTPWSHCTRTCGAGVQSAERKCNNPEPKFGGRYCTGERKRYRICKTTPCTKNHQSFRHMQCSEFDTVPYNNELHQWIPIYNTANPCELHCKPIEGKFAEKLLDAVIDGTPCFEGNNSKDVCINGMCKSVGCDYEINSNATEDRCGICLGDGSTCHTIKKAFNQSEGFGYVDIGMIPKGARDIKIEEMKEAGNFLAIRSEEPEKYYLNGAFIIQWNGEYKVAGTIFHYQRTGNLENLTATGPTNESIWIQLLFQENNPGIEYEYVIQKEVNLENEIEPLYIWKYGGWSDCSATCGTGIQSQIARCVNKGRGVVKNTLCDTGTQPMTRQKRCYKHDCPPRWWAGEWQQCSTTCGPTGEKKRTVLCIRTVGSDEQALPSEDCHHLTKPKDYISCNRDVLCPSDWTVSNWSQCSVTCGGGVRTRNVTCAKNNDEPCNASKKPNTKALCGLQQCPLVRKYKQLPTKSIHGTKIANILPRKTSNASRDIILPKSKKTIRPSTKTPSLRTSTIFPSTLPPSIHSIRDDFQLNDIPNSTHFNVDYKYNFVLVENNRRKVGVNSSRSIPVISNEDTEQNLKAEIINVTEKDIQTGFTTTNKPEEITPTYNFLTTLSDFVFEDIGISTATPENDFDTDSNSIIESRSKRHKGLSKTIQNNFNTVIYNNASPTQASGVVTTEKAGTLYNEYNISVTETVIEEQNSTNKESNEYDITFKKMNDLQATNSNVSKESFKNLYNKSDLLNVMEYINATEVPLNLSQSSYWIVGDWSECSTTCGLGGVWRHVECSTANETDCKHIKKPDPARRCHLRPCATWRAGNWSKCSSNCGGGFKNRDVQCTDVHENRPLRPFHCHSAEENPKQNVSCNTEPCLSWLAKPWGECSKTCGSGIRQRSVICPREDRCDWMKIPITNVSCNSEPCVDWKINPWMECSVSCGGGIQRRTIECINTNNKTLSQSICEKEKAKPTETQQCSLQECKKLTDLLCKKDKMSINFCKTVKSIGKCSVKSIQAQCCLTCLQQEDSFQGG